MNSINKKVGVAASYLFMIAMNAVAVLLPLAGRTTSEVSDSFPNLFAPAGYTFAIWGVIYLLLGIYVIYQFRQNNELVARVNKVFIVNALLNASWIVTWHYKIIWLSVLIILGLLITLIAIAEMLRSSSLTSAQRWFIHFPFSVYFGWVTVATIANVVVLLVAVNWKGFGISESLWTVVILLIGMFIGSLRMLRDRAVGYGLVLLWAYGGILSKHTSLTGFAGQYPNVITTLRICLLIFVLVTGYVILNPSLKNNTKQKGHK